MYKSKKSWCTKKYLKKVKSTEILIKRKSLDTKKIKSIKECIPKVVSPKRIGTPKRIVQLMSPNGYVEIKGSKEKNNYGCSRRIDFLN
ncbi:uncharacterized protein VNE69_04121 [Vairimorpha necatrix]|uniref:Uncharacterized protein n=1 Tax=Vairimorpha necatrix TaxID=6039 RepID=A0AAX4JBH6_9MICR